MPVFYFLVLAGAAAIWFLASAAYRPIGAFFRKIFRDAKDNMLKEDKDEGGQKEL